MTEVALLLAATTVAAGLAIAFAIRFLPTVRLQLSGLALLAVVLPLVAVLASGWVMFHMHDDAKILSVAVASAASAVVAALLLGRWILKPLERLRGVSAELAAGDLAARAPTSGPSEIADLGSSFNEMAASIEQLFDARRQLVAWASHDLRTPLASMTAMIEAIEDGLAEPGEYLPALRMQVRLLNGLVHDLFELARIDAGALTLELRETPLDGIVETCLQGLEAEARARHIRLHADLDRALPPVRCAPDQVERVLFNLLTNALRHTPSDGAVAVRAHPEEQTVVVAVEDTGDGLTAEAEARMFERFWRGDPARNSRGSGLGLAIAQGLVEAQGGRIWAENRPEGGARISFTLQTASTRPLAELPAG
jgi:signal transduction histidine kinase